jgi:hypothetical protein
MDIKKLNRGQVIFASILLGIWGLIFFLAAALAGVATAFCCGLVFGHFNLKSDFCKDIAGVISGVVLFLSVVFLLKWEKRSGFILKSSLAVVQYFSRGNDRDV